MVRRRPSSARATLLRALAGALLLQQLLAPAVAAAAQLPPLERSGQPLSDPAEAWTAPLDQPMPLDPDIVIGVLENGLHYYIRENRFPAGRAELRLVVRAGSLLEDDDQLGIAHFVEHMAFNGTVHFAKQDLVKALESFGMRFGADINAYTSFDQTIYMLRIPTDAEEIVATAFQILEDWAHGLTFDPEEVEKERGVVIEEWRLGLGAGARLRDKQFPVLFRGSRYAERLPIGTLESLRSFDRDAAVRFYRDWYRPDLMAVIAVGDFDKHDLEARIRRHFGPIRGPEEPRPRPLFEVPFHRETLFAIATDPEATGSTVAVLHKLPLREEGTIGAYRRSLMEGLYHGMFNRRLLELAQQPEPPFLGASSSQGIFVPTQEVYVLGAAVPDGGVLRGLEALLREARRVARFGFTESELEREKRQALRDFERIYIERQAQPSGLFADEFERAFLQGESVPGIPYEWALHQRFIPEITLEEVNGVGRQFLTEENRVVLVAAPEKAGLSLPAEAELLAVLERAGRGWLRPYRDTTTEAPLLREPPEPGAIVEERAVEELGLTEWCLSNGVRVVLKPTDIREDEVLFQGFSPGGTSLAPDEEYVAAMTAVEVVSASGFGPFSAREITNMLADQVVEVEPYIEPHEEGFRGGASPRDLETLFQLVYLKFTAPRADRGVFELLRQQIRARLANRGLSPEAAFHEALQTTLTQNHPRRRPITVELVDEMDLRASYRFYRERFADAGDFTFVFVGSFDVETIRPLVLRYLGGLPSAGREESWRDEGVEPPAGIVKRVVRRGLDPKGLSSIVFTGALGADAPAAEGPAAGEGDGEGEVAGAPGPGVVAALAAVLQTRLREVLREDLGSIYAVQVRHSVSRIPEPEYSVSVTFGADPGRIEELTGLIFGEIRRLQTEGPASREVDNVRAALRRRLEIARQRNGFWLRELVDAYRADRDPREILGHDERIDELTPAVIREAARAHLRLDNYVQVSLVPEAREAAFSYIERWCSPDRRHSPVACAPLVACGGGLSAIA